MVAAQPHPAVSTTASYTQSQVLALITTVPDNGAGEGTGGMVAPTPPAPLQTTTPPTPDVQTSSPAQLGNTSGNYKVGTKYPLKFQSTGRQVDALWNGANFDPKPAVTPSVTVQGKFKYYILTHIQDVKFIIRIVSLEIEYYTK